MRVTARSILLAACIAGGVASSVAGAPKVDTLAESALAAALKSSVPAERDAQIRAARLDLQTRAVQFPGELAKAKVVLARGYTAAELQRVTSGGTIEVLQVEAKIPVPGSSEVYTVILAGAALEQVDGTIGDRVQNAFAAAQGEFLKLSMADAAARAKYRSLSRNPLLIYAFESIGTTSALASLGTSADVRVVQRLPTEDTAQELEGLRSLRESMRELRTPAANLRGTDLPDCQSQQGVSTQLRDTGTQVHCPVEIPEDPIPLPTTALPAPTGVAFVDVALDDNSQFIDSYRNSDGTGNGKIQISMPASFWLDCDSSVPGSLCPNDYTYTTRGLTGGTLAWGAAIKQAGGPVATVVCRLVYNWPGSDTVGSYGWWCYRVVINTPKWTYAAAVAKFSFGGAQVDIPISPGVANVTTVHKISTFAWNGIEKTAAGWPDRCIPTGGTWDVSRPCQLYDINGSYVRGQSGFEDKIIIPNPSCSLPRRTGYSTDKNFGCFTPDRIITNLPTAYLDTTFGDDGGGFTASIGVADGKQLLVGFPYESRVDGSMKGWENIRGLTARHLQAVTARDNAGAPCITGVGGAAIGSHAACMFNVDLSIVGPDGVFR